MKIKVEYIFSKNKKIGSKLISAGTQFLHPDSVSPSHVAILVNDKYVFESTLETGVRLIKYPEWIKHNTELKRLKCLQNWSMEQFKNILRQVRGKKYDYLGVTYLGYRLALKRLTGLKVPESNLFNHDDKYFCCEVIGKMTRVSYEMTTPIEMMYQIEKQLNQLQRK